MGLLKLGSIYKKSKSKKDKPETPPLPTPPPTLEPLSLNLDINLSQSNTNTTVTKQPINNDSFINTPATSPQPQSGIPGGSLFDDIFSELNPRSNGHTPKDELQSDISLSLALSQHLQIDEPKTTTSFSGTTQNGNKSSNNNTNSDRKEVSDFLLGEDSIYSSYIRNLSSFDNHNNNNNDTIGSSNDFSTSMFASLMGPTPQKSRSQPQSSLNGYSINNNNGNSNNNYSSSSYSSPPPPLPSAVPSTTKHVLDSDISDSDDSKMSDESDDDVRQAAKQQNKRVTKGIQPIMERRPQDHHLLVQRKIDNWSNRVDPEANKVESREAVISRMKDRHRNEVKMAALRQQQQQQQQHQQQVNMMNMHRVPQVYGAPIIPHTPIVSPHPGMMLDPSQMYHNPHNVQNEYASPPLPPQRDTNLSPPLPPSGFIPPHNQHQHVHSDYDHHHHHHPIMHHSTSTPQGSHSKNNVSNRTSSARASTVQTPANKPVSSKSSPTSNNSSTTNLSVSSSVSSTVSNTSNKTQKQKKKTKSKQEEIEVKKIKEEQEEGDNDDEKLHVEHVVVVGEMNNSSSLETLNNQPVSLEDPAEADIESSGEEDVAAAIRRKKSLRKLRQKDEDVKQVRSSRSAPNLKKKQGKKSKSRSSSRRNSQDATITPNSEYASHEDQPMQTFPRSQSHTNMSHTPHRPIRHLKSESDLRQQQQMRAGPSSSAQYKLNYEWERMQAFQREQQLKNKNKYGQNFANSTPPQVYPVYAPVYYPTMGSSSMPYSTGGVMDNSFYPQQYPNDPRASGMPGYGYPGTNQTYYTR